MSKKTWRVITWIAVCCAIAGMLNSGIRGGARQGATESVLIGAVMDGIFNGIAWFLILALVCWIGTKVRNAFASGGTEERRAMREFLNVLGGILVVIAAIGSIGLFILLDEPAIHPAIRFGVALGAALNCLVTAAILLGMAQGLELLERIADGETNAVGTDDPAMPRQAAVRQADRTGAEAVRGIAALRRPKKRV